MKKLLLIDLDDTLLRTGVWKQQTFTRLAEHIGVNPFHVYTVYEELKWHNSPRGWYHVFAKKLLPDKPQVIENLLFDSISQITPNLPVVQYLREFTGHKRVLTFGDERVQSKKIAVTGIDHLIDDVWVTDKKKILLVGHHMDNRSFKDEGTLYSDVTIVDDDYSFLREVNYYYPWIRTIDPQELRWYR